MKGTNKPRGSLFIVTGPSGAGKGTVLARVLASMENVFYSISATTRKRRETEIEGKSYFFISKEEFSRMAENGEFLEYAEYVGNCYGTPEKPVNDMLANGQDVILEIEVQGALIVKEKRPDAILVFITPPSFDILEKRLRGRGTESEELVERRLEKARSECRHMEDYQYIVINDRLDEAACELRSIIISARCRSDKRKITIV